MGTYAPLAHFWGCHFDIVFAILFHTITQFTRNHAITGNGGGGNVLVIFVYKVPFTGDRNFLVGGGGAFFTLAPSITWPRYTPLT